jgi:hypothetical protein
VHPKALAAVLVAVVLMAHIEEVVHRAVSEGVVGFATAALRAEGRQVA